MPPATTQRPGTVSAHRAAELAGCTYRQLDHWCRTGLVVPFVGSKGSGSRRAFTRADVRLVWALAQVLPEQRRAVAVALTSHPEAPLIVIGADGAWPIDESTPVGEVRAALEGGTVGPMLGVLSMGDAPVPLA